MPFLAILLPAARSALGLVSAAIRTPLGAATLAFGLAWLIAGSRERAACEARAVAFRAEMQRAAEAEHARREAPGARRVRLGGAALGAGEVERLWGRDRASLVTCGDRHAANVRWRLRRDAGLAGD
jgi:hypothetical protein